MKRFLFLAMGIATAFGIAGCSSDDDDNGNSGGKKYLAEITVKEHPWKFGERSNYGEDYENFKYDKNGNLIEKTTNYYYSLFDSKLTNTYKYTYDERNRVSVMEVWSIAYSQTKYQYNEFDSVSVMTTYNSEGKAITENTYEYDSNKRLSKEIEHVLYMGPDYGYVYEYSYSGNTVTKATTDLKFGTLDNTTVYEYDSHHNLVKSSKTSTVTGTTTVYDDNTYDYNVKGQLTRWASKDWLLKNDISYHDYYYNEDGTIDRIHLSYSFKDDKSDLIYTYTWK